MERLEIEDRRIIIPLAGPGPHETRLQMWPSLSAQNWERNRGINELLGVGDYSCFAVDRMAIWQTRYTYDVVNQLTFYN